MTDLFYLPFASKKTPWLKPIRFSPSTPQFIASVWEIQRGHF